MSKLQVRRPRPEAALLHGPQHVSISIFVVSMPEQAEQTSHAFPGRPILAHWPYEDPTKFQGTPEQVEAAYFRVASRIRYRLQLFNNLSFDQLDRLRIEMKMKELGESGPENPVKICVTDPLVVFSAC